MTPNTEEDNKIARIITHEAASGTFYIAQRHILIPRWFSEDTYEWESFVIRSPKLGGSSYFAPLDSWEYEDSALKDPENANYYCKEWVRVSSSGKQIKIWSEQLQEK